MKARIRGREGMEDEPEEELEELMEKEMDAWVKEQLQSRNLPAGLIPKATASDSALCEHWLMFMSRPLQKAVQPRDTIYSSIIC